MSAGLGKAGVIAFKWSAISAVARFALQLIAQVILARLLGPANYGIFGMGLLVLAFTTFLSDFGFAWNLLRRADLREADIRFAFTWQVVIGAATTVLLWCAAPWIADYFREPKVLPVIRWLSLTCLLNAAASVAGNLIQRDLNFRAFGLIQVASYALGYIFVGVPLALLGHGVNALVAAWLVQAFSALVGSYAVTRHALRPLFRYPDMARAFGNSGTVFLTNVVNWSLTNIDRVFIGRMLDAHSVGLYSVGYNVATMPNTLLLGALQPSFTAAASHMRSEPPRLARAYLQMLATIWAVALPAFAVMSVLSSDLMPLMYGTGWRDTSPVLAILFLAMPAYASWAVSTPVLWNMKRKRSEFFLQLPILVAGAAALYFVAPRGIVATAAVAGLLLVARMLVVGSAAFRVLNVQVSEFLPYVGRGMLLGIIGAVSAWCGSVAGHYCGSYLLALILGSLLAGLVLVSLVYLHPPFIGPLAAQMLIRFFPRLESAFARRSTMIEVV